jgi:hypothetical protein
MGAKGGEFGARKASIGAKRGESGPPAAERSEKL